MRSPAAWRGRVEHWLGAQPDDDVLRWLLRAMLALTVAMLAVDFIELNGQAPAQLSLLPDAQPGSRIEDLPLPGSGKPSSPSPKRPDARLAAPMTFELVGDGRLLAVGTIEPGTARTFAAEIDKRGGYVRTVVLHSPGGSVTDALQMGRLIRARKLATEVAGDSYCASSCPLVFAGGVVRQADDQAAIGVHQVLAAARDGITAAEGMDSVQRVSADCQRYLQEMGVDALVWIHAMETPNRELFYFKPQELLALKLATELAPHKPAPRSAAKS